MKQKTFFTGFHKCATTSVLQFLSDQGYKACDHGALPPNEIPGFCRNLRLGKYEKILETADEYDAFADSPWFLLYELMDKEFDAKFVHAIRDPEDWYKSCLNYFPSKGESPIREYIFGRGNANPAQKKHVWIERYLKHQYEVMKYFKNKDNFLLLDIFNEENTEEKLFDFLNIKANELKIGNHNSQIYPNSAAPNLKICVVQLADEAYASKYRASISTIGEYCKLHGYTHEAIVGPLEPQDCHINYQKPLLLQKYIEKYDYVIWMDADIVPANYEIKFEDIIESFDKEIYFCRDPGGWLLNSGVVIFKNCETSKGILKEWWGRRFIGTDGHWRDTFSGQGCDQGRLIDILKERYPGLKRKDAMNPHIMNCHPKLYAAGDFLVHCMGYASEDVENLAKHTFNLKQKDREKFFLGFGELVPNMAERKTGGKFFDRIFSPKSIVKKYHELESKGLLMSRDEGEANKTLSDKNWKNPFDGD